MLGKGGEISIRPELLHRQQERANLGGSNYNRSFDYFFCSFSGEGLRARTCRVFLRSCLFLTHDDSLMGWNKVTMFSSIDAHLSSCCCCCKCFTMGDTRYRIMLLNTLCTAFGYCSAGHNLDNASRYELQQARWKTRRRYWFRCVTSQGVNDHG